MFVQNTGTLTEYTRGTLGYTTSTLYVAIQHLRGHEVSDGDIYGVIQHIRGLEVSDDDIYVVIQHIRGLEVLNDDIWHYEWKVPFDAT